MNATISLLVQLQKADTEIGEYESTMKALPVQVEEWRKKHSAQEDELAQMKQQIEELNKQLRHEERRLQTMEDDLGKHQAKIYAVKTQKEMIALDQEIAKTRQESSQTEDKVLGLMGNIENITEKIEAKSKAMAAELVELQAAEKDCQAKLNQTEQKLKAAKEKKEKIVIELPKETMARYEKLRANKNNLAVVAVKGGVCQGCFMTLPPQVINEVKSSSGLVVCEQCIRILYCEDEKR